MRSGIIAGALAVLFLASAAQAQVIVVPRTVYYGPRVTTYYAPAAPSVSIQATTSYYAPAPVAPPVTTYYAPAPVTAYYAPPVTTYYAPGVTTTYYGPAPLVGVAPVVVPGRVAVAGRGIVGQPKLYRPGQPVRNALRFVTP